MSPNTDSFEIEIGEVKVVGSRRELSSTRVREIASSIRELGLQTPISVKRGSPDGNDWILVSGNHRIEAMKVLGESKISCVEIEEAHAPFWELSENLHRSELNCLERAEHLVAWIDLGGNTGEDLSAGVQAGSGGPNGVHRSAFEKVPLGNKTALAKGKILQRSRKIAGLSQEAKREVTRLNLGNSQSALLKAAKQTEPDDQVSALKAFAERRVEKKQKGKLEKQDAAAPSDRQGSGPKKITSQVLRQEWEDSSLAKLWDEATEKARNKFIKWLEAKTDESEDWA